MSKKFVTPEQKKQYEYPSRFGSHAMMIDEEMTNALNNAKLVVLKDEHGHYTTERNRLDSGIADPNRFAEARLTKLFSKGE